jgi:hypothetical protein
MTFYGRNRIAFSQSTQLILRTTHCLIRRRTHWSLFLRGWSDHHSDPTKDLVSIGHVHPVNGAIADMFSSEASRLLLLTQDGRVLKAFFDNLK